MLVLKELNYVLAIQKQREYVPSCYFCYPLQLQHLPYRDRANRIKNLVEVCHHGIACHSAITEHSIIRLLICNRLNNFIGNVVIKASIQEALGYVEYLAACNSCFLNVGENNDTEVKHNLEQQIFGSSVLLDVVCIVIKQSLLHFIGLVKDLFHV